MNYVYLNKSKILIINKLNLKVESVDYLYDYTMDYKIRVYIIAYNDKDMPYSHIIDEDESGILCSILNNKLIIHENF
jgi:hypothetical protein